ncbi:MAG: hypothetical protein M1549_02170 [Candidatus Dependentiae bacterium]|nr:hypothetical protein [Candidatus Dependentiae bacterium]
MKNTRLIFVPLFLMALACTTQILSGTEKAKYVLLKNNEGQYLMAQNGKCIFVNNNWDATPFKVEQAAAPKGLVGSSHRAFSYNGKYLYYDLTLRTAKPATIAEEWLAPIQPDYRNNYHSGPSDNQTLLIAEKVDIAG